MKIQDFLCQWHLAPPEKDKHCSAVFRSTDGNFYSYGYHYPLMFQFAGEWYINTSGYSSSTAAHITYAKEANPSAHLVELPGREISREEILKGLFNEMRRLEKEIEKGRENSAKQNERKSRMAAINCLRKKFIGHIGL